MSRFYLKNGLCNVVKDGSKVAEFDYQGGVEYDNGVLVSPDISDVNVDPATIKHISPLEK